jgi:signal-transduction protein with cAMP-binding, CBS, and nucleotidyltransferase domain
MLVHGQAADAVDGLVQRYATLLHEGFEACGLQLDEVVTPRNNQWRGSLEEWGQRLVKVMERGKFKEVVEMLRLADQTQLHGDEDAGSRFRQLSFSALATSPVAVKNLVSRVVALSNGIGMMGGLRFEKSGPNRGRFDLLENALLPLSASVSALALLKRLETLTAPLRVRELLWRRDLNVDMAERLLQAWHALHELRLTRESCLQPDWTNESSLYVNIEEMHDSEQNLLRGSLETVGAIQRHVGLTFSGMEE